MGIGAFLAAMMAPLVARVLMAIGFSVVSIVGVSTVLAQLKGMFLAQAALVPVAGLNIALLAGCGVGGGIIFGAITTKMALYAINNTSKILGVK
ncbi:DUF2523 family protein [Rhodoferax ferrireducens]|uniref:DUF2523 family protein n=1 Tax=Rhodoferax ferrireducens TaxID=192843 RepID=UPI003BB5E3B9